MLFKHKIILLFVLTLSVLNLFSATKTASVSGSWSNDATWGGAAAPVSGGGDDIVINAGITVTMDANYSTTGTLSMTATCVLDLNSYDATFGSITGDGTIDDVAGAGTPTLTCGSDNSSTTFAGIIQNTSGTIALTKTGSGAFTLSGANTFTGGVTLSAGQININHATALGTGTFTIEDGTTIDNTTGGTITMTADNPMTWNGNFTFTGTNALDMDHGAVAMGASTRTVTVSASTLSVGGTISGTNGLTKAGAGIMILGNVFAANWTGTTTISAGTFQLYAPNSDNYKSTVWSVSSGATLYNNFSNVITNDAVITVDAGGTWNMNNQKDAIGYIAGGGDITNFGTAAAGDGFEIDLPATGTGSDFSGIISGPGTINIRGGQGAGKQVLSGLNTYTGPTYIRRGTLSINTIKDVAGGASSVGNPANASDGTIPIGSTTTTGTLEYTGTTQSTDRVIDLAGTTGGAIIDQSGTGTLTFTSTLTATGVGAKTLTLQGSTAGAGVISGVIPDGSGTTSLAKSGTGTWTISGANTFSGTTTVNAGTLQLGAAGVIPDACATTVTGTLDMNTYSETIGSLAGAGTVDNVSGAGTPTLTTGGNNTSTTFSGVIKNTTGTLSLAKNGSGTFTLSGANAYSGTTTLNAGTLQLGAAGVVPNASDFIANGGTFSTGSGAGYSEALGTLTLNASSVIALGTGSHSLSFAASDGTSWTGSTLLQITGWQGNWDCSSGTSGKIYTGSSAELSAGKLSQIFFTHPISALPYTACQLGDGEIVPTGTLPVKLISFDGELQKEEVHLKWITASEINSDYFEILRSPDAVNFESIGTIDAAGNSNGFLNYSFIDPSPLPETSYYKLVQYDFDGANESFHLVPIINNANKEFKWEALYPNPSKGKSTIIFFSKQEGIHRLNIYNVAGELLYSALIAGIAGENKFDLNFHGFANGNYFVSITNPNNEVLTSRLTKED